VAVVVVATAAAAAVIIVIMILNGKNPALSHGLWEPVQSHLKKQISKVVKLHSEIMSSS
jgi:siroheme synthase (precorrin-2 oxidase/ferrochelatase)